MSLFVDEPSSLLGLIAIFSLGLVSPGPDFALVLRNSLWSPSTGGFKTALGISTGIFVHVCFLTIVILLVEKISEDLPRYLGLVGGVYLFFVAAQTLAAVARKVEANVSLGTSKVKLGKDGTTWAHFRQGFLTNLFNGKAVAFFWSMLLALASELRSNPGPFIIMALYMVVSSFVWFWFVSKLLSSPWAQHIFQKIKRPINFLMGLLLLLFSTILVLNGLGVG